MDLIGYVRVSRVGGREGDTFISPAVQRERCQAYADLKGHRVVAWLEDLDQSGGRMDRPGLQEALRRIEAGEAQGLVVAKLDRFSRSLAGALSAIEQLEASGAQLISVAESIDSSTPTGRLMRDFMLSIAQWYRETMKESWDTSRSRAIHRGVHIASHPPTGYKRGPHGGLVVNKKTASAVTEAFRMRAAGETYSAIGAMLDKRRVRGEGMRGEQWTPQAIRVMLRNRAYLGEARSGDHVNADAHEPIVTLAEYEAAQVAPTIVQTKTSERLLSGLLRCAGCRYCLQADKTTDHGKRVQVYRCRAHRKAAGTCETPATSLASVVEPYVIEQFLAEAGGMTASHAGDGSAVVDAEMALAEAEAELAAFIDAVSVNDIGADAYRLGAQTRQRAVDQARSDLGTAARTSAMLPAQELRSLWPSLTVSEQRKLLAAAIDCIFLRGGREPIADRIVICWRGTGPTDLPSRGRVVPLKPFRWPDDPVPTVAVV